MAKRKKEATRPNKILDTLIAKRGRGRPGVRASEISGRAYNYRLILSQTWGMVGKPLLEAKTEEDVIKVFENTFYKHEFAPIASLILEVLRDPDFPKREREARINFLADSLAGLGRVKPRTSRDICGRERAKDRRKSRYKIIRHEFYVECACGYEGPALDNACRKCGAQIPPSLEGWLR